MGRNTKRPNTTKGPIKPKQKHYKNYKRVPILRSEVNLRSLSKGLGHDSINCSNIAMTILNHASIKNSRKSPLDIKIASYLDVNVPFQEFNRRRYSLRCLETKIART